MESSTSTLSVATVTKILRQIGLTRVNKYVSLNSTNFSARLGSDSVIVSCKPNREAITTALEASGFLVEPFIFDSFKVRIKSKETVAALVQRNAIKTAKTGLGAWIVWRCDRKRNHHTAISNYTSIDLISAMEECLPQQWTKSALRTGFYYVTWDKDFDWDALRTQIEAKGNRCLQYNLGVLNGTIDTPFTLMQKEISKELAGKE